MGDKTNLICAGPSKKTNCAFDLCQASVCKATLQAGHVILEANGNEIWQWKASFRIDEKSAYVLVVVHAPADRPTVAAASVSGEVGSVWLAGRSLPHLVQCCF